MSSQNRMLAVLLSALLILNACAHKPTELSASKQGAIIEQRDILTAFEQSTETYELDPRLVIRIITNCCTEPGAAIALLEKNDFKVEIAPKAERGYDQTIYAMRYASSVNLLWHTRYHVSLNIKDGKVAEVRATRFKQLNGSGKSDKYTGKIMMN